MRHDPRRLVMAASLMAAVLMLAGKLTAFALTGSQAIFSDAVESVIHLFATAFAAFSLWYVVRPADEDHPYGHGKMAYFSSGFEGGLILIAALGILYAAITALIEGPSVQRLGLGIVITGGLALVNLALGMSLLYVGRKHNSLVLVANGRHVLTDMWTSVGVVVGVALVWLTDLVWLDPVVAILVALQILWTAVGLIRGAVDGLMEAADQDDTARILAALDRARADGVMTDYHQLRHRRVNDRRWIEYHLLFPDQMALTEAHDRSHDVEATIDALFAKDEVFVTAHLEPDGHTHPEGFAEPDDALVQGRSDFSSAAPAARR